MINQETKSGNTRTQLYWNTLIRIPTQLVSFIISIWVARILMPKDFGILGICMMLIGYANLFTNFGLNEGIIQKRIFDKKALDSIFTFDLSISILLASGFFLSSGLISDFFRTPECMMAIRVLSISFIITSFHGLPHAILRRDMNFKAVAIIDVIQAVLMSVITLLLAIKGFGYWALVYGQVIPLFIIAVLLCVKAKYLPFIYYNHVSMMKIYDFGFWNFLRAQLLFISQHVDKFIIGKWMGTINLGYYDKAMSIGTMPLNSLTMHINSVLFSSFSLSKEDRNQTKESFKQGLALVAFINLPVFSGLFVVVPFFVHSLLGEKWTPMIVPFQIILIGLVFKSLGGLCSSLNVGIGKYKENSVRFFWALLIFIVTCILLERYSIEGIAVSFLVFCIIEILLLMDLSIKSIGLPSIEAFKSIYPALAASAIMMLITLLTSNLVLKEYSITNMLLIITIGSITYCLCLFLDKTQITQDLKKSILRDLLKRSE